MYSLVGLLVEPCSQTLSARGEAGNEDPIQEECNNTTFAQLSLPPSPPHCHQPEDPLLHVYVEQQHINKKTPHMDNHIPCLMNNIIQVGILHKLFGQSLDL